MAAWFLVEVVVEGLDFKESLVEKGMRSIRELGEIFLYSQSTLISE